MAAVAPGRLIAIDLDRHKPRGFKQEGVVSADFLGRPQSFTLLRLEGRVIRSLSQRSSLIPETQHRDTDHDHGQREHLSHGEGPEDKADVRVRFAKQFNHDTAQPIAGQKTPKDRAGRVVSSTDQPEYRK